MTVYALRNFSACLESAMLRRRPNFFRPRDFMGPLLGIALLMAFCYGMTHLH